MHTLSFFTVLCTIAASTAWAVPLSSSPSHASLLARGYSSAPAGALVVSKSPRGGEYGTIQAAVDAIKTKGQGDHVIFVNAGTYDEAVFIEENKASSLTIIGVNDGKNGNSYVDNQVTITHGNSQKNKPSNDASATLRVHMDDFKLYNVNVVNSFGQGAQAVALSAKGNRHGYYACSFDGFQDTVLSSDGSHYFAKSSIKGATDIIFGERGRAFFHRCDISIPTVKQGWVMAPGGDDANAHSFFVLDHCSIFAQRGGSPSTMFLGRPWGKYAQATVQATYLADFVDPLGWDVWHAGDTRTQDAKFSEYQNQGPGSKTSQRAPFSSQLSQPVSLQAVLGPTNWVDQSFVS